MGYLSKRNYIYGLSIMGAVMGFLLFQNMTPMQTQLLKDIDYLNGFSAQDPYKKVSIGKLGSRKK